METYTKAEDGTLEVTPEPIQPEPVKYTLDELQSSLEASLVRLENYRAEQARLEQEALDAQALVDKAIELKIN